MEIFDNQGIIQSLLNLTLAGLSRWRMLMRDEFRDSPMMEKRKLSKSERLRRNRIANWPEKALIARERAHSASDPLATAPDHDYMPLRRESSAVYMMETGNGQDVANMGRDGRKEHIRQTESPRKNARVRRAGYPCNANECRDSSTPRSDESGSRNPGGELIR